MHLTRIWPKINHRLTVAGLNGRIADMGFNHINNSIASKQYNSPTSSLNIIIQHTPQKINDIISNVYINSDNPSVDLLKANAMVTLNERAFMSFAMKRTASGLGMEGGFSGMHNVNLPVDMPGPRWWPAKEQNEDMANLNNWIHKQDRYNPEYTPIGGANSIEPGGEWYPVGVVPKNTSYVSIQRDRQEAKIAYTTQDGSIHYKKMQNPFTTTKDLAQEMQNYQVKIVPAKENFIVYINKTKNNNEQQGIWQINGAPSTPGAAFIYEDDRTGWGLHPEYFKDPEMTSGSWMPGTQRFLGKY